MKIKDENCKGCSLYEIEICEIRRVELTEKCPCRECIVKVICKDACKEYAKLRSRLLKEHWNGSKWVARFQHGNR